MDVPPLESPHSEGSGRRVRVLRFGVFALDTQSGELRRHGLKIRLPDQAFQILQLLIDRPGEVVTREELHRQLWSSDTFVAFDAGLNSAIRKLRDALDDSAEHPRFVETIPRRGYRFIGKVEPVSADSRPAADASDVRPARSRLPYKWIGGGLALAVTMVVGFVSARGWWQQPRTGNAAAPIRSLVVLPFENLTGDPGQDYFVDGVTDILTTDLAQARTLRVISRTSAMQYKGAKKALPAIGQELDVDAVLEGAIARAGQHVRITAQLIHAATDRHVWAQSYEGEMSDMMALHQTISRAIVAAIDGQLASGLSAGAPRAQTVDPQAYDAYLKGLYVEGRQTDDGWRTAVGYYEDTVRKQPDFAAAYAALARAQLQLLYVGSHAPRETIPKAEAAARKALQLDETLAPAHQVLGQVLQYFYWQWENGARELRRARSLELNAADTETTPIRSLIRSGRFEEASARARKLDPVSFREFRGKALELRAKGQYDIAIEVFRRALQLDPERPLAHFDLGVTWVRMGRLNEAVPEIETAFNLSQGNQRFQAYLGYAYAATGRMSDARRILQELESQARHEYVSSFGIAMIYDALGQKEPAIVAFERAYQDRAVELVLNNYPPFKTIASDSRFQTRMNEIRPHR